LTRLRGALKGKGGIPENGQDLSLVQEVVWSNHKKDAADVVGPLYAGFEKNLQSVWEGERNWNTKGKGITFLANIPRRATSV